MADDPAPTQAFSTAAAAAQSALNRTSGRATALTPDQTLTGAFGAQSVQGFSPGEPLIPMEQRDVRLLDFPASINTNITPRSNEAFNFQTLRAFSNIELVRLAIETRKDQIETLDWSVKTRNPKKGEKGEDDRCKVIEGFFQFPDGVNDFATWSRLLLEEMLTIDAPAIERQRTRAGDLAGLLIVPGDTIHPMVDMRGRRPVGPKVAAYQQIIKGIVWANLTNDDLIYLPRNQRPGKIYGFSPVEQIIVTIQTVMARQTGQLAYFTDGNIPAGILTGPEGWTPGQIAEMQKAFDEQLKSNFSRKSTAIWVPNGTTFSEFKEAPLKQDFDEWLARIVQYAFSLPPTPFIKAMNRSTASSDADRGKEEGLQPIKLWLKRILDRVIATDFKAPDLEFVWTDKAEVDAAKQAKVDDLYLRNGSITINEVRDRRGLQPVTGGDELLIYSPTGVTPLDVLLANPVLPGAPQGPGGAQPNAGAKPDAGAKPNASAGSKPNASTNTAPSKAPTTKLAKASTKLPVLDMKRAKARRHETALKGIASDTLQKVGDTVAAEMERKLRAIHKVEVTDLYDDDADREAAKHKAEVLVAALKLFDLTIFKAEFTVVLHDLYVDAATSAYGQLAATVPAEATAAIETAATDYAKARAGALFDVGGYEGIVSSTQNMVADVVAKGLMEGQSASGIADALQSAYAFSEERAAVIAGNEASKANTAGVLTGYESGASDTGVTLQKFWETEGDDKVEEVCLENEAAGSIPMNATFPSGDEATPAHPNCRCSIGVSVADPTEA